MEKIVKNVPVSLIKRYREFNRQKEERQNVFLNIYGQTALMSKERLELDIFQNGIKEPLRLFIYNGKALLAEGNHRLEIAERLFLKQIPLSIEFIQPGTIEWEYCQKREKNFKKIKEVYKLIVG